MPGHYARKLVLFGAGKIGRSFIARLFSSGGWETVFIDIERKVVDEINSRGSYDVVVKDRREERLHVTNIRAVHFSDTDKAVDEIVSAGILAISVGQKGLEAAVPLIARSVHARHTLFPHSPLDIIIAENMRDASGWLGREIKELLPGNFPFDHYLGLVETSIGKMVPIMPATERPENPLDVYAESYNTLILDGKAFKNPVPDIPGLAPKENMKAWVDRKLFIHNLGHAALAYFSFLENPGLIYTWEALENEKIKELVKAAMDEAAGVLISLHPAEFTNEALTDHIDDLLLRFANRSLGDTIYRVGCDLGRKLGPDDRLVPVIKQAILRGLPYGTILEALISGVFFDARNEEGNRLAADEKFLHKFNRNITEILRFHCNFDPSEFPDVYAIASRLEMNIKANLK